MKRLTLTILLFAAFIAVTYFSGGHVGVSMECREASCLVAASSSWISIVLGIVIFAAMFYLPKKQLVISEKRAGLLRMIGAVVFDIFLVITGLSALLALPSLVAESSYTGSFKWAFARDFLRTTDWPLTIISTLGAFLAVLGMRMFALRSGRPSFGQYLMGYVVVGPHGGVDLKTIFKRIAWAVLFLAIWPLYLLYRLVRRPEKDAWDSQCNTRSAKFNYS